MANIPHWMAREALSKIKQLESENEELKKKIEELEALLKK